MSFLHSCFSSWQNLSTLYSKIHLYFVRFRFFLFSVSDFLQTACLFYSNKAFRSLDLDLLYQYVGVNPYRLCKNTLLEKGSDEPDAYGETPLASMQEIAKRAHITKDDTVFELGAGRGRCVFWLRLFTGAKVVGIDIVEPFIQIGESLAKKHKLDNVEFITADFLEADLSRGTKFYLHGTLMKDEEIVRLSDKLLQAPNLELVITVSFPLGDFAKDKWEVIDTFPAQMSWGKADVYIQRSIRSKAFGYRI